MCGFTTGRALAVSALLFLQVPHRTAAPQGAAWTWRDNQRKTHTLTELDSIVKVHELWVRSKYQSGKQADLGGAYLTGATLRGANLAVARLNDARLNGANLSGANLSDAYLWGADLTSADLSGANLTDANLWGAALNRADLRRTDLSHAALNDARLSGAIFEPTSLPDVRVVAAVRDLEFLTYEDNPDALVQLRKLFVDGGFRDLERKITYALKRREAELSSQRCPLANIGQHMQRSGSSLANCGWLVLNRVFFDWTCQYGMSPGRPLSLGLVLWLLCSVLYFVCIHSPGTTGLFRVYGQGIEEDSLAHRHVEEILPAEMKTRGLRRVTEFIRREWLVLRASMFFSLMSAFNIGFRDINFGRWLRLLTRQEFDIKALGWARVVAGWQSLISVYLIALWVLTYFGRPFG